MSPASDRHVDLIVNASGQDIPVSVNVHQHVEQIVREALRLSGNAGQPPGNWELRRDDDGSIVVQGMTVAEAALADGMHLTLVPKTGEGG